MTRVQPRSPHSHTNESTLWPAGVAANVCAVDSFASRARICFSDSRWRQLVMRITVQGGGPRRVDREDLVEPCEPEDPEHAPVRRNHRHASARTVEALLGAGQQVQPGGIHEAAVTEVDDHRLDTVLGHGTQRAFECWPGGEVDLPPDRDNVDPTV